jgi:hypothetical protein
VSREELVDVLPTGDILLVDVLSPKSYATAHIDEAINLPVAELRGTRLRLCPIATRTSSSPVAGPPDRWVRTASHRDR